MKWADSKNTVFPLGVGGREGGRGQAPLQIPAYAALNTPNASSPITIVQTRIQNTNPNPWKKLVAQQMSS